MKRYLKASPATRMTVEVDYVAGNAPSRSALSHLSTVLREVADKPGGLDVVAGNEIPGGRETWSVDDLRALEKRHRETSTTGDHASMWIVYVDGSFAKDEGALGVAYAAGSAAIFRERIGAATSALVNASAIERAVLTHEAGHLLALVNIGYRSRRDHEDPEHPKHSSNDESVMYWAVEDVSIRNVLRGGPPDTFDADDKADLAMLKAS